MTQGTCADLTLEREYIVNLMYTDKLPTDAKLDPSELSNADYGMILDTLYQCEFTGDHSAWRVEAALRERGMPKAADLLGDMLQKQDSFTGETSLKAARLRELAIAREYYRQVRLSAAAFQDGRLDAGIDLARSAAYIAPEHKEHKIVSLADCVAASRMDIEKRLAGVETRVRWGDWFLDERIGSIPPCQVTIGGSTSAGKSQLILYMARCMAKRGTRVGIISIEDPDTLWGDRSLAMLRDVPASVIYTSAALGADTLNRFIAQAREAEQDAKQLPISVALCVGARAAEVVDIARRMIREKNVEALYVDYIQAARFDLKNERWDKAVSDLSKQLKAVCLHAGIPLVAASQLKRADGEPGIHSLKESGDLENMSEAIVLIWKDSEDPTANTVGKIGKVKWGRAGTRFTLERDRGHGMVTGIGG